VIGHVLQGLAQECKSPISKGVFLSLEEHCEAFEEEFGEEVSTSTIGRAIAGLPNGGWPLKKSHS
jgi:hypothetical protein